MSSAAIALDIDGTITTAEDGALERLKTYVDQHNVDRHKVSLYINTARPEGYCQDPMETVAWVEKKNSFCRPTYGDPVDWKMKNMDRMVDREGVHPRCAVLVDDRQDNIEGVRSCGYHGIKVNAENGITNHTVDEIVRLLKPCFLDQHDLQV